MVSQGHFFLVLCVFTPDYMLFIFVSCCAYVTNTVLSFFLSQHTHLHLLHGLHMVLKMHVGSPITIQLPFILIAVLFNKCIAKHLKFGISYPVSAAKTYSMQQIIYTVKFVGPFSHYAPNML